MSKTREQITDEAIGWTMRLRDAEARVWEEFTQWLESDPTHLQAYEEVAAVDESVDNLPQEVPQPPLIAEERPKPWLAGRRAVLGWAAAAAVVGVIGLSAIRHTPVAYVVETAPGERRSVALQDGSSIHLNGGTRIVLDRENSRFARLDRGEALFDVVHNDSMPFRVEVGEDVVEDAGTVFNIVLEPEGTTVAVAEGAVIFNPADEHVSLVAGEALWTQEQGEIETGRRDPAAIGGWRSGELVYSSASLRDVARDLSRNTGLVIRADPAVAGRTFSGSIMLDKDHERLLRRVAGLLSVQVRRLGNGWMLVPSDR